MLTEDDLDKAKALLRECRALDSLAQEASDAWVFGFRRSGEADWVDLSTIVPSDHLKHDMLVRMRAVRADLVARIERLDVAAPNPPLCFTYLPGGA